MVTPADTPDFRAIVLPVSIPLLYLGSLPTILSNHAPYRRKRRTFASVDGWVDRKGEQDLWIETSEDPFYGHRTQLCMSFYSVSRSYCLVFLGFYLYYGHVLLSEPTLTYGVSPGSNIWA